MILSVNQKKVCQFPGFEMRARWPLSSRPFDSFENHGRRFIDGNDSFVVQFSQWDMEGPLTIGEFLEGVQLEVSELADSQAGVSEKQEALGVDGVDLVEFLLNRLIGVRNQGPGQAFLLRRRITSVEEIALWRVFPAPGGDIFKEAAYSNDEVSAAAWFESSLAEVTEPAFDVGAVEAGKATYFRMLSLEIANEVETSSAISV